MYEKFTIRARKVMQIANQQAQRFNHEYVGTEHILLGLVKIGVGNAIDIIESFKVDLGQIIIEVERQIQSDPDMIIIGRLPLTPRAKKVVEFAEQESEGFNDKHIGTEHILLGLLHEENGIGGSVLNRLGVNLEQARVKISQIPHRAAKDDKISEKTGLFSLKLVQKSMEEKHSSFTHRVLITLAFGPHQFDKEFWLSDVPREGRNLMIQMSESHGYLEAEVRSVRQCVDENSFQVFCNISLRSVCLLYHYGPAWRLVDSSRFLEDNAVKEMLAEILNEQAKPK